MELRDALLLAVAGGLVYVLWSRSKADKAGKTVVADAWDTRPSSEPSDAGEAESVPWYAQPRDPEPSQPAPEPSQQALPAPQPAPQPQPEPEPSPWQAASDPQQSEPIDVDASEPKPDPGFVPIGVMATRKFKI